MYDPHIQLDSIYGSNRNFLLSSIPHIGKLLNADLDEMLTWADILLITQKLSPAMQARIISAGKPVLDLSSAAMYKAVKTQEAP